MAWVASWFASASPLAQLSTPIQSENDMTDQEWKNQLNAQAYSVLRQKATEPPFTGLYWNHHKPGEYYCAGCGQLLFHSQKKYDSGSGWPSFWESVDSNAFVLVSDTSHGMIRTEVLCARCGGHLGHVFNDGPQPTGLRYCINSAAMSFKEEDTSSLNP